jgi:putative phage-type endonuclease
MFAITLTQPFVIITPTNKVSERNDMDTDKRRTFTKALYGSQEWLEQRRTQNGGTVFGASEIPALMGVSPWDNLTDLVIKKVNPEFSSSSNDATLRGHILEPALIEFARRHYGEVVLPTDMYQRDRIVATLDGIQFDESGKATRTVEAKTTTAYALSDTLPITYFWQVQAQMDAVGCNESVVVALDKYMRLGFWVVEADHFAIEEMREQAELIGSKIDDGSIFDQLTDGLTSKQVDLLYPKPEGERELTHDEMTAIDEWRAWKDQLEMLKDAESSARDRVTRILKDVQVGTFNGQAIISYKRQTRKGSIDVDRLLNHNPEISALASQYRKPDTAFRVLRMK